MSRRVIIGILVVALALFGAALLAIDDDSGDDTATPGSTAGVPGAPGGTVGEAPAAQPTIVPTSAVPADGAADAETILNSARPNLVLTARQEECLANRLGGDPELLRAIGDDPAPGSDGYTVLEREAQRCIALVDLAPAFVAGIEPALTDTPDDGQRQCLAEAYVDLDEAKRQSLLAAGLDPGNPEADAGRRALRDLVDECGLALTG